MIGVVDCTGHAQEAWSSEPSNCSPPFPWCSGGPLPGLCPGPGGALPWPHRGLNPPATADWSNAKREWINRSPMDCEEMLVEQAARHKAKTPSAKVFVYRNLVKAL